MKDISAVQQAEAEEEQEEDQGSMIYPSPSSPMLRVPQDEGMKSLVRSAQNTKSDGSLRKTHRDSVSPAHELEDFRLQNPHENVRQEGRRSKMNLKIKTKKIKGPIGTKKEMQDHIAKILMDIDKSIQ